jgi:NADH-quinone oxidoreductase subunit K
MTPSDTLVLAALLFGLGAFGVVARRNALVVLMSIELMLNAANLTFLTFARWPQVGRVPVPMAGHAAVFFVITVAAAEAAVGLAIIIAVFRARRTINVDEITALKL